jgi:hypothetical protein
MSKEEILNIIENFSLTPEITYDLNHFMKWNDETKHIYRNCIESNVNMFYSLFISEDGKLRNIPGEEREYSFLNYLNTNNFCVSIIINFLNKKILSSAKNGYVISSRQLDFTNHPSTWLDEMKNATKLINKYKEEIFVYSPLFLELKRMICKTVDRGKESEEKIRKYISDMYPHAINFKMGGDGDVNDMNLGIDISFDLDNKTFTIQNKKCEYIRLLSLYYMVSGVGGLKNYHTDYLSFEDKIGNIFLFENKNVEIKENKIATTFKIPKENLMYKK